MYIKKEKLPDLIVRTSALNGLLYCGTVNLIIIKTQKVDMFFVGGGRGGVRNTTSIYNPPPPTFDLYHY
jgi:hypothetical protein